MWDERETLSEEFAWWGSSVYQNAPGLRGTPLYAALARGVADDPEVLALVEGIDRGQLIPNLLFGAAHYLLLRGEQHPLRNYFAMLTPTPRPPEEAYPHFRDFALQHADIILQIVTTRRVQTNEVMRCTALVPAFGVIAEHTAQPLALIEIGSSAGLNLLWDEYFYDYGAAGQVGDPASPVHIRCEVRGTPPPLPAQFPRVSTRLGIDLYPVDVRDDEAMLWVRALIWPEHTDRAALLTQAGEVAKSNLPRVIAGDVVDQLPAALAEMPTDAALCLYDTYSFNQIPANVQERIIRDILQQSQSRDVYRISMSWSNDTQQSDIHLTTYRRGEAQTEHIANCDSHGRWLEWIARSD